MSNRVVIRNGKPGFIINGTFVPIPDGDNVNTTSPRIPRQQSGLDAVMSVIKNTLTGKGAAGIRQDATKPNPNYGGRPKVTMDPDEYFGTGDYGSGGPKEKPKQKFPDLRGGDAKVDGDGNPKVDYTKTQPTSIKVEPYKDTGSFFDGARGGKYDTTTNPTPPKTLTPQQRAYGPDSKLTKDQQLANLEYDKKRYETDDKDNPILGKLRSDQTSAKEFGLKANAANFPNQRIFIDPETGKRKSKFSGFTNSTTTKNPTNAATGGVNPRAGSYAAELKRTTDALSSNFGKLPKGTIKPAAERMKKEAYDVVLDYLLSEGHVDTVEEAHYVMLQMTSEHVQDIVEGKYADSVTYVKGTAPVRASYGGKPESFTKETYKKKGKV